MNTPQTPVSNTFNSIRQKSSRVFEEMQSLGNSTQAIIGLVLLIAFSVIIAYLMYSYISKVVFNKYKIIVPKTKLPLIGNVKNEITLDDDLPVSEGGNGIRRSYTFWIYVKDNDHSHFRNILYLSKDGDKKIINTSPHIFMDKSNNKMYIRFKKQNEDSNKLKAPCESANTAENLHEWVKNHFVEGTNEPEECFKNYMKQGIVIDYVPMQRWVHIGIVINDHTSNSNGRYGASISAYVDGELVAVANHDEEIRGLGSSSEQYTYNINNLDLDNFTKLVVGGEQSSGISPGFSGLLCKFAVFNYDLNDRDIHNDYNKGPVDNLMAKLGIGTYGVRSPVYRIS
tara:strand:+ start:5748 stop:6770 length:1023 start_codon:yes stop_codon:yes gene_type:complete